MFIHASLIIYDGFVDLTRTIFVPSTFTILQTWPLITKRLDMFICWRTIVNGNEIVSSHSRRIWHVTLRGVKSCEKWNLCLCFTHEGSWTLAQFPMHAMRASKYGWCYRALILHFPNRSRCEGWNISAVLDIGRTQRYRPSCSESTLPTIIARWRATL